MELQSTAQLHTDFGHFELLAAGAGYWPQQETLFVADLHLGKEAAFRRGGIPVPEGATEDCLRRVSELLVATRAERLLFVGDLLHAELSRRDQLLDRLERFFIQHAACEMILVKGNHDRAIQRLEEQQLLAIHEPSLSIDRVRFCHFPDASDAPEQLTICGHLHPGIRVELDPGRTDKQKCFWLSFSPSGTTNLVLPAFGRFTGAVAFQPGHRDRVWPVFDEVIFELPRFATPA